MGYHYLSIIRSMFCAALYQMCAGSLSYFVRFCRWDGPMNNKLTRKCWNFALLSREDNNSVRRLSSIELVNRLRGSYFICFRIYLFITEWAKFLRRLRWRWWKNNNNVCYRKKNSQSCGQDECHAMQKTYDK